MTFVWFEHKYIIQVGTNKGTFTNFVHFTSKSLVHVQDKTEVYADKMSFVIGKGDVLVECLTTWPYSLTIE